MEYDEKTIYLDQQYLCHTLDIHVGDGGMCDWS